MGRAQRAGSKNWTQKSWGRFSSNFFVCRHWLNKSPKLFPFTDIEALAKKKSQFFYLQGIVLHLPEIIFVGPYSKVLDKTFFTAQKKSIFQQWKFMAGFSLLKGLWYIYHAVDFTDYYLCTKFRFLWVRFEFPITFFLLDRFTWYLWGIEKQVWNFWTPTKKRVKKDKIWFFVKKSKFWKNHDFSKTLPFMYPFYPFGTFL